MWLIAECYANKCFAEELKKVLSAKFRLYRIKVIHSFKQGRDRILKDAIRYASNASIDLVVAIIDYEKGISRMYISEQFELIKIDKGLLLGINKKKSNLIAVIFDPNIEEGFLCEMFKFFCKNVYYYEKIKSKRACNLVVRYLKDPRFQRKLHNLANRLIDIVPHII